MSWRRVLRWTAAALAMGLLGLGALALVWRRDATATFHRVRDRYDHASVLAEWVEGSSITRLVELHNARGEAVAQAYVRMPLELASAPRIVLVYAGAKTGKRILDLIPPRPGLVLVGVQYPYESPRTPFSFLTWPAAVRRGAFRTVGGGMLAISYLEEDHGLAVDRLLVVGSSLGTFPAVIHAALDERVPVLLLVHGGGHLPTLVRANVKPIWYVPPALALSAIVLDSFDPLHWIGRVAPRRVVMISPHNDTYFPAASARLLYEAAGEPKEIIWTRTGHVRSRRRELVAEIIAQIESYLDRAEQDKMETGAGLGGG